MSLASLIAVSAALGLGFVLICNSPKVRRFLHANTKFQDASKVAVGLPAPVFSLSDYEGRRYRPSSLRGQWVVIFFLCGCSNCVEVASACQQIHQENRAVVLGVAGLNQAAVVEFRKETKTDFPILFDSSSRISELYHSFACPTCWLIDPEGKIVYGSRDPEHPREILRQLRQFVWDEDEKKME